MGGTRKATSSAAKKGKSTVPTKRDAEDLVDTETSESAPKAVSPEKKNKKEEDISSKVESPSSVAAVDVTKPPDGVKSETLKNKKNVGHGFFYTAVTSTDVKCFAGTKAQANLTEFMNENSDAVVKSHTNFMDMISERDKHNVSLSPVAHVNLTSLQNDEKANAFLSDKPESTPPVKIKTEPGVHGVAMRGTNLFRKPSTPSRAVVGETVDLTGTQGTPVMRKPNLGSSATVSPSSTGGKLTISVICTNFVTSVDGGLSGVVAIEFTTSRNGIIKQYWAMKIDILATILHNMESTGQFNQGGFSIIDGTFSDIQSAQLRSTPYGPNIGQATISGNKKFDVDVMYLILSLPKASLVKPEEEVIRIGRVIKSVVSADWFEESYMECAIASLSDGYCSALKKPKEHFFRLLKDSTLSVKKNASLDCFLLDDAIHSICSSISGSYSSPDWSPEVRKMAYHSGKIPGETKFENEVNQEEVKPGEEVKPDAAKPKA